MNHASQTFGQLKIKYPMIGAQLEKCFGEIQGEEDSFTENEQNCVPRVNCEFSKLGDELWIKTKGDMAAGDELLVCYSDDQSYWTSIFSTEDLAKIEVALASCGPPIQEAEECLRGIQL
ncbi:hypothetical protein ACROYT_G014942 [Oculina patagonica]